MSVVRKSVIKAAVIGLGVGEHHIKGYESEPRCKVVTLCDINEEKLADVGRRHPGKSLTTNPSAVLADPDIDVVSIASYDDAHYQQVKAAILAGKHVFVEKPLCLFDEEFDDIDRLLYERPTVRLSSNFVLRRAPQFRELKRRVESGALGRLYYFEGDYNYGRLHKITEGWRGKIPFYSVSHGGAIHLIDLTLWLSQRRVVEVTALGNQVTTTGSDFRFPDLVTALLRLDDGATAKVTANFGCVCPHHHALSVFGTQGTFVHGHQGGFYYHSRDKDVVPEKIQLTYPQAAKGEVQRAFLAHILDGVAPEVSAADVMNVMAVSLAIERSLRSRHWEPVLYGRVSGEASCSQKSSTSLGSNSK